MVHHGSSWEPSMSSKKTHPQWPAHQKPHCPDQSFIPPKRPAAPAAHLLRRDPCHRCTRKTTCGDPARGDQQPMTGGSWRKWCFEDDEILKRSMILLAGPNISSLLIFIGTRHLHLEWLSPGSHSFVTMLPQKGVLPLEQVESSVPTFFLIPESRVLSCIHCLYF